MNLSNINGNLLKSLINSRVFNNCLAVWETSFLPSKIEVRYRTTYSITVCNRQRVVICTIHRDYTDLIPFPPKDQAYKKEASTLDSLEQCVLCREVFQFTRVSLLSKITFNSIKIDIKK